MNSPFAGEIEDRQNHNDLVRWILLPAIILRTALITATTSPPGNAMQTIGILNLWTKINKM